MPHSRIAERWLASASVLPAASASAGAQHCETVRVSLSSSGAQGEWDCDNPSISADGRYVAFTSAASNLVPGDTNGSTDVFVHDRLTGQTIRVSVDSGGNQANSYCGTRSISDDGRHVAFWTNASNLVPADTNNCADGFVHDRATGQTTRVNVDSSGSEANEECRTLSMSGDGRFVAFSTVADNMVPGDSNGYEDAFVHDRVTGQTTRVSVGSGGIQGNLPSWDPALSSDGRYVVFQSAAKNLVESDTNNTWDTLVHDRVTGRTARASVSSGGVEGNNFCEWSSISNDGRWVVFMSLASNLVPGDTNNFWDVFAHDLSTLETTRMSVDSFGGESNLGGMKPSISADGAQIAFRSGSANLAPGDTNGHADVFVHRHGCQPTPFCFGDGSGMACPCGNPGAGGEGCANSGGSGGVLATSGSVSASVDDLAFDATQLLAGQPALLFVGLNAIQGGDGAPFGDGLRCAGGSVVSLGTDVPDASGAAVWGPGLGATAGWSAGDERRFQVWYRDPSPASPCGFLFNLTNGIEVTFGA